MIAFWFLGGFFVPEEFSPRKTEPSLQELVRRSLDMQADGSPPDSSGPTSLASAGLGLLTASLVIVAGLFGWVAMRLAA